LNMSSNAWDILCTGTSAYFELLFPGEGLNLFQVEPCLPGRHGSAPSRRSTVSSYPVPEREAPVATAVESSNDSAWDRVTKGTSAYFDVLFPEEGFETRLRHLGKRHSIASYAIPEREVPEAAVVEDGNAAPSLLEAYFEQVFPGEGLNVFQGRSSDQSCKLRAGKSRRASGSGAGSQGRAPHAPVAHESSCDLEKVYSSDATPPEERPTPADGSKIALGSPDGDTVSTVSGSEALPYSRSNSSLTSWEHTENSRADTEHDTENDMEGAASSVCVSSARK